MEIRKITSEERKEYYKLCRYAFGNWHDGEVKEHEFIWFLHDHTWAIFLDGKIESGMVNHRLVQSVRGVPKRMGGIGAVITNPIHRRKGHIRKLFEVVFDEMRELNIPVSMLSPFKRTYYEMFGYVGTWQTMRVEVNMRAVRHYLDFDNMGDLQYQMLDSSSDWTEFLDYAHKQGFKMHNGYVSPREIHNGFLEEVRKDRLVIIARDRSGIRASAIYTKKAVEHERKTRLDVEDFLYSDRQARDAILHFFSRHFEQVGELWIQLPQGFNIYEWFVDSGMLITPKAGFNPWMVRVMDVAGALNDLPATREGSLKIEVTDPLCEWNNGTWEVVSDGEKLHAKPTRVFADVEMDIRGLSSLVYGAMDPGEILYRGMIQKAGKEAMQILESWFPKEVLYTHIHF